MAIRPHSRKALPTRSGNCRSSCSESCPAPWYYPSGRYVLLYDGEGTFQYHFDAVKNTRLSAPGRDVLDVISSAGGIFIFLTSTDPNNTGNYVRNIRLVYAPKATKTVIDPNETLLANGEMFNPNFISRISQFKTLRFMDWMHVNNTPPSTWAERPTPTWVFWNDTTGGSTRQYRPR